MHHIIRFPATRRDFHSLRHLLEMQGLSVAVYPDMPGYDDQETHLAIVQGDHDDNAKVQRIVDAWAI